MGCVWSKQVRHQKQRTHERTISVTNHMVALTSSTLGVLELSTSPRCKEHRNEEEEPHRFDEEKSLGNAMNNNWVEKTVVAEKAAELEPVTINAWEIMEGLDDEVGESPAKAINKSLHKMGAAGKENEVPATSGKAKLKVGSNGSPSPIPSPNPLRELGVNNFYPVKASEKLGSQKVVRGISGGSVPCTPLSRRVSEGSVADLKVSPNRKLNSRRRLSIDLITEPDSPLFSPSLVATLEKALENLSEKEWNVIRKTEAAHPVAIEKKKGKGDEDPLENFEQKCPPGGANAVVLYTTTLRGIRKTFEDCNNVRDALESYGIYVSERDVSMHLEFRNELRKVMGKLVTVPRLFIKGRYVGGADEVLLLHEEGKLSQLLVGLPTDMAGKICDGCGGVRFVPCLECSGSCKLVNQENQVFRCPECNENGLIQCPICC